MQRVPIWSNFILLNFNHHIAHHYSPSTSWEDLERLEKVIETKAGIKEKDQDLNEMNWSLKNRRETS